MFALPAFRMAPLGWLVLSVALHLAGSHLYELLLRASRRSAAARLLVEPLSRRLAEFLYYVILPYLALLRGDLLARPFGLSDLNWIQDIGVGLALTAGIIVITVAVFRYARRSPDQPAAERPIAPESLWRAGCCQMHWTFYRAGLTQITDNTYLGACVSLVIIALELALNPALRRHLNDEATAPAELVRLSLLATTTVFYILVRNLPLLILAHWLTEMAARLVLEPRRVRPPDA